MTIRGAAMVAMVALCCAASGAGAQTWYRGYDVGPDFGAMLQEMQRREAALGQHMQGQEQAIIGRAMQDPRCQAMYRQHLAEGGRMPFPQFAYLYAATGGFTPDGIARFRAAERGNQDRERIAREGLRDAERRRGDAQRGLAEGYAKGQAEQGCTMQGTGTWIDPFDGQPRVLPYMGGSPYYRDPATGRLYARDEAGRQYAQAPNGQWVPMAPAR